MLDHFRFEVDRAPTNELQSGLIDKDLCPISLEYNLSLALCGLADHLEIVLEATAAPAINKDLQVLLRGVLLLEGEYFLNK